MRKLLYVGLGVLLSAGFVVAQGPLGPLNSRIGFADDTGALKAVSTGACGTLGPAGPMSSRIVRTDADGALQVCGITGGGGGGDVATDAIFNAAGDLVQGTGSDTAARLAIGTANQLLRVNAGATAAEWASTLSGLTLSAPTITGAITLPDNVRQTFNPGVTSAGFNFGAQTTDPGTPSNGDAFYDSDDHLLRLYINSAWANIIPGALVGVDIDSCAEVAAIMAGETGTCGAIVLSASPTFTGTVTVAALTASTSVTVPADAFDATWDGDATTPRKDDIYDYITATFPLFTDPNQDCILEWDDSGAVFECVENATLLAALNALTGALDFGGLDSLEIPNAAAPTVNAAGEIALDTNYWGSTGGFIGYDGAAAVGFVGILSSDTCADQQIPKYNATPDTWTCEDDDGGVGGSTDWDSIGDPAGNGTIAFAATLQLITSTLDAASGIVLELSSTDAALANAVILWKLSFDDDAGAEMVFADFVTDKNGTPASNFRLLGTATVGAIAMELGATGVSITDDGDGAITLLGRSAGNDEDLTINLDDTADTIAFSSSTAAATILWTGFGHDLTISQGSDWQAFRATNASTSSGISAFVQVRGNNGSQTAKLDSGGNAVSGSVSFTGGSSFIQNTASANMDFGVNNGLQWRLATASGNPFHPISDNTNDVGTTALRVQDFFGYSLNLTGTPISTAADGTISGVTTATTFTKNDANTRQFYVEQIKPIFNFGGSNTTTTVDIFSVDSTNTAVTGATINLATFRYGGTLKSTINAAGNIDAVTFSAAGDSGYTGATCTAFTGGLCTTGSEPEMSMSELIALVKQQQTAISELKAILRELR